MGKKSIFGIIYFVALLLILNCNQQKKIDTVKNTPDSQIKNFTTSGAWCWFADPRAVHYSGQYDRTYATWVNNQGAIQIGFYDHDSNAIKIETLHEKLQKDDHANPALYINDRGVISVFYSRHCGVKGIFRMEATSPEQITQWKERDTLQLNPKKIVKKYQDSYLKSYTYPNPVHLEEENRMYLFWRGAGVKPNFSSKSDTGTTWQEGQIFIKPAGSRQRPYMKVASKGKSKIHFAFTNGHPRQIKTNSIYYAVYSDSAFYKSNGNKICNLSQIPFKPESADLVYNAEKTGEKAWVWDIAVTDNDQPVIVYSRFPDDSNHVYYYARRTNEGWQNHKLVNSGKWFPETPAGKEEPEPNYSAGVVLDHDNPNIVYLSNNRRGTFEIEKWETRDKGQSWQVTQITKNSKHDNVRPVAIRNAEKGIKPQVLWMNNISYIGYTNYKTQIKMDLVKDEDK